MAFLTQFERNPSSQVPPDDLSIAGSAPQARVDPRLIRLPVIDATDNRFVRLSTIDRVSQRRVFPIAQDDRGLSWHFFHPPEGECASRRFADCASHPSLINISRAALVLDVPRGPAWYCTAVA
jgi:hypothetical protein